MTEPAHPQAPPTHPGPIPTPNPVRRPLAAHAIIALSPPVIAWLASAIAGSPAPGLAWLFMLPPFGLVLLIEARRPKQSLARHVALVLAPGILMFWMILAIMTSTSSTAVIAFIFAPVYGSFAVGVAYGIVSLAEFVLRRRSPKTRWSVVISMMAVLSLVPPTAIWFAWSVGEVRQGASTAALIERSNALIPVWSVPGNWVAVAADNANSVVYAADSAGYCLKIDANGATLERFTLASASCDYLVTAELVGGGDSELLAFQGGWPDEVSAWDSNGAILWTYAPGTGVNDVWAVDLDGDGLDEVLIGYNGPGGVHVVNSNGQVRWRNTSIGNVWSVRAGDLNGDGRINVVTTSAAGQIHVFDDRGKMIRTLDPGVDVASVCVVGAAASSDVPVAIGGPLYGGGTFAAVGFDRQEHWSIELPDPDRGDRVWMASAASRPWVAVTTGDGNIYVVEVPTGRVFATAVGSHGVNQLDWLETSTDEPPLLVAADGTAVVAFRVPTEAPYVAIIDVSSPGSKDIILHVEPLDDETALLQELYDLAVKHFPNGSWGSFGPDSAYREIVFFSRGRKIQLSSWHPIYEQDPNLVASSEGLTSLAGKTREEFLAQDDPEYVAQRRAFDDIEARLRQRFGS